MTETWVALAIAALAVASFVLYGIWTLYRTIWRSWRNRKKPLPQRDDWTYNWALDDGLINVWARDDIGELVAVFPREWIEQWRYK
jgi:hypothetical protein